MSVISYQFIQVDVNMTFLGQNVINSFYYAPDFDTPLPSDSAGAQNALESIIDSFIGDAVFNRPALEPWYELLPTNCTIVSVDGKLKYNNAFDIVVYSSAVGSPGSRSIGSEFMPPNITASFYAPSRRYRQRGAKVGLSGMYESDQQNGLLLSGVGTFKAAAITVMNAMYAEDGLWLSAGGTTTNLRPVVIPRIQTGTPPNRIYRMPYLGGDIPDATEITPWQSPVNVGSQNTRKLPVR